MSRYLLTTTGVSFTMLAAAAFFFFLLFFVGYAPFTFDEAFNAILALSLSHGVGYGSHLGGIYAGFNPEISTGFLFIAPYSVVLQLVGPSITSAHLYSLGVTLLFFVMALIYARRVHPCLPLALIFLSMGFLDHGKTDLFEGVGVRSLPEPLYGLWFQFLGNMSGTWAAIACVLGCVSPTQATLRRLLSVFLCAVFACNSKIVNVLPLASSLLCAFLLAPKLMWASTFAGGLGALVGLKLNSWLARAALDADAFIAYQQAATLFFRHNQRPYDDLMREPSWSAVVTLIRNVPAYWRPASHYIGDVLIAAAGLFFLLSAGLLFWRRSQFGNSMMLRLLIAFGVSSLLTIAWWAAIPGAPVRHLTAATPFVVATLAVACVGILANSRIPSLPASRGVLALFFIVAMSQKLLSAYPSFLPSMNARQEQQQVSQLVQQEVAGQAPVSLCGDGWWYPHEISFLSNSPKTPSCSLGAPRQVVIPKHLFPEKVGEQRSAGMCRKSHSGEYYDVYLCGSSDK